MIFDVLGLLDDLVFFEFSNGSFSVWLNGCRFRHIVNHGLLRDLICGNHSTLRPVFSYKSRFLHYFFYFGLVWLFSAVLRVLTYRWSVRLWKIIISILSKYSKWWIVHSYIWSLANTRCHINFSLTLKASLISLRWLTHP